MEFGCNFDREEMNVLIQAVMQLRKKAAADFDCSENDYDLILELEKKLVYLAGYCPDSD